MHVVDAIAERISELLIDATDAQERVSRDKGPNCRFDALADLPAIDIRIGEEQPHDDQSNTTYVGVVQIEVELYVADAEANVSSALLELRRQAHVAVMAGASEFDGVRAAGATAVGREAAGGVPIGFQTAHFEILFQHSIADPAST